MSDDILLDYARKQWGEMADAHKLEIVACDIREIVVQGRDGIQGKYLISLRALDEVMEPKWLFESASVACNKSHYRKAE